MAGAKPCRFNNKDHEKMKLRKSPNDAARLLLPLSSNGHKNGPKRPTGKHFLPKWVAFSRVRPRRRHAGGDVLLCFVGACAIISAGIKSGLFASVSNLVQRGLGIDKGCDEFGLKTDARRRSGHSELPPWIAPFRGPSFLAYQASVDRRIDVFREAYALRRSAEECNMPLFSGEYGYELAAMVPWAYYRHRVDKCAVITEGVEGSKYLYFFSKRHTIVHETILKKYTVELNRDMWLCRIFPCRPGLVPYQTKGKLRRRYQDLPPGNPFNNSRVHRDDMSFPTSRWLAPPFKEFYRRDDVARTFVKPLVIIFNKYTVEWGEQPVNFIPLGELREILTYLTETYYVVYVRLESKKLEDTDSRFCRFGDKTMIRAMFPESVVVLDDLLDDDVSPDGVNLMIFSLAALSDRFVSVQRGNSVVASFFGGMNIILAKRGAELTEGDYTYYHRFSNATVEAVDDERELVDRVKDRM